jgi:hypothetical protein
VNLKLKLTNATVALIKEGSIKERLATAYRDHLVDIDSKYLGNIDLEARFKTIKNRLGTSKNAGINARKLSVRESEELAGIIYEMLQITQAHEVSFGPMNVVVKLDDKVKLPAFLTKND